MTRSSWLESLDLQLPPALQPHEALLRSLLRPCVVLRSGPAPAEEGLGTRYGGRPWVARGTAWPQGPGGPLDFVGQLDFGALKRDVGQNDIGFPAQGVLAFFYDEAAQPWGFAPEDRASWSLVWNPDPAQGELLTPPGVQRLPPLTLSHLLAPSLPSPGDEVWGRVAGELLQDDAFWEAYDEYYLEFRQQHQQPSEGQEASHQLGGQPDWVQDDGRLGCQLTTQGINTGSLDEGPEAQALAAAAEWTLLWQIASHGDRFMWGDLGNLYLMIRQQDLALCDFDRAWVVLQCG